MVHFIELSRQKSSAKTEELENKIEAQFNILNSGSILGTSYDAYDYLLRFTMFDYIPQLMSRFVEEVEALASRYDQYVDKYGHPMIY